jgi:hypothetical protein
MSRKTGNITLHTSLIRWEPFSVPGSVGYAWMKTLSKDEETGARTALIRYEPGFRAPASDAVWPMDIYTLEGSMDCGDLSYGQDTYHYRPAGTKVGPISTDEGITRLVFTADSKDPAKSTTDEIFVPNVVTDLPPDPPSLYAPQAEVEAGPDSRFGAHEPAESAREMFDHGHLPPDPTTLQGAREHKGERWRKILRLDPIAEMAVRAQRVHKVGVRDCVDKMHKHPWHEEAFLIRGNNQDYDHDIEGHWKWMPGTYVCRQPDTCMHGDATKLDDDYYMIVRSGWTADPVKATEWREWQDANEVPVPPISFQE